MTLKLNGSSSGSVSIDAPASTTGGADVTLTLPVNDGDNGEALLTNGSGTLSWGSAGGILQVQSTILTAPFTQTYNIGTATAAQMSTNITPSSTSSKILITWSANVSSGGSGGHYFHAVIYRGGSVLAGANGDTAGSRVSCNAATRTHSNSELSMIGGQYLDSPNSTSQQTYDIRFHMSGTETFYLNQTNTDGDNNTNGRTASTLTLMEVAG